MKKLWISLWVLVLVGGCAQKPQEIKLPEESMVEEPTTIPEKEEPEQAPEQTQEPEEEKQPEQNTENLAKKIDETKDWVYLQDGSAFSSESSFDEWLLSLLDLNTENKAIYVNIDSTDGHVFNKLKTPNTEHKGGAVGIAVHDYKWYQVDHYLVILEKSFAGPSSSGIYRDYAYTFDLETGEQLDTVKLAEQFTLTLDEVSKAIEASLISKGYEVCGDDATDYYFINQADRSAMYTNYSSSVNDSSVFYISPTGDLSVVINITDNVEGVDRKEIVKIDKASIQSKETTLDHIMTVTNEVVPIDLDIEEYAGRYFIQEPTLLWESEDAKQFNEEMSQLAQRYRNELTYYEDGSWHTASLFNTYAYINEGILSIVIQLDRLAANTMVGPTEYKTYNFSIKTQKLMTNDEIFDQLNISTDEFQSLLNEQLNKDYLSCATPKQEDGLLEKPCFGEYEGFGSLYGNASSIYIKEGIVHMFVHVHLAMYQEYIDFAVYRL